MLVHMNGKDEASSTGDHRAYAACRRSHQRAYKPLPLLTAYKNLGFDIADFPQAYAMYESEITLPLHTNLSDEDVEYVIEAFKNAYFAVSGGNA